MLDSLEPAKQAGAGEVGLFGLGAGEQIIHGRIERIGEPDQDLGGGNVEPVFILVELLVADADHVRELLLRPVPGLAQRLDARADRLLVRNLRHCPPLVLGQTIGNLVVESITPSRSAVFALDSMEHESGHTASGVLGRFDDYGVSVPTSSSEDSAIVGTVPPNRADLRAKGYVQVTGEGGVGRYVRADGATAAADKGIPDFSGKIVMGYGDDPYWITAFNIGVAKGIYLEGYENYLADDQAWFFDKLDKNLDDIYAGASAVDRARNKAAFYSATANAAARNDSDRYPNIDRFAEGLTERARSEFGKATTAENPLHNFGRLSSPTYLVRTDWMVRPRWQPAGPDYLPSYERDSLKPATMSGWDRAAAFGSSGLHLAVATGAFVGGGASETGVGAICGPGVRG